MEGRLLWLLDQLRGRDQTSQGYGPANLVALLRVLRGDLRGLDLSRLALRGVFLQGVEMQDTTLSEAMIQNCVFSERFDDILTVTISSNGVYWAAASRRGEIRVWDVESGQCLRILGGYVASLFDIDWSPDGLLLASGGADTLVTLWNGASATSPRVLRGHRDIVQGVAWSPDGRLLASGGNDGIGLWDTATGVRLQVIQDPDAANTIFQGVAWSPDGRFLACGSYLRGVQVWEITTRTRRWVGQTQSTRICRVSWSPDETQLVGGGSDGYVYLWDARDGTQQQRLAGHDGGVMSVAWSPDGTQLASGGSGREGGELFVWDAHSGQRHPAWEAGNSALVGPSRDGLCGDLGSERGAGG